jgi:hypothetical protein
VPKLKAPTYEDEVETAIKEQLKRPDLTNDERNKAIGNAIRWAAVKGKLILPEHGAGFEGDE